MEQEAKVAEMVARVADSGWMAEKWRAWIIGEATRIVGLDEPLLFKMACRILVRNGTTLDDLARRHS